MKKSKHNRFIRLIASALVVVSLLQWVPSDVISAVAKATVDKPSYIPGDVNGDGYINAMDVNLVRRHIVGGYNVKINALAADVDANGNVDSKDVNNLRRFITGGYDIELKPGLERFTVKFETGEGTKIKDKVVIEGTAISSLATPYWAEHIFTGWYYDAALEQPVGNNDKVTKNMTLYASWLEQVPLDTLDKVTFASAVDVKTDFTIEVVSTDTDMTAEDVLVLIDADDLAEPDAKDIIAVNGGNGAFTVSGVGGFREGGSYRITLNNDKLSFKGQPESARQYNFTVDREDVINLAAKSDIKYLPLNNISNIINNGQSVSSLNLSLYESDGTNVTVADLSTGSFKYSGNTAVSTGDIVCVYDGEIPTNRTLDTPDDKLGDMAYLEITAIDGNTYTYESADPEEVVFTPDILPLPEAADTDSDANTVTVDNKYLDYSADVYSYINLDSQTTVDVGDFFAFYSGEYGVESGDNAARLTGYGKIVAVSTNDDNNTTTITFISVTWEDVEGCMDVHTEQEMTAEQLLEGVNTDEVESEIEQQAIDSGFADEAATYLTSVALATDNFNKLNENINLEDYKVTLSDGTPVSPEQLQLMSEGGVKVEIEETDIKAKISKHPTHLGDIEGTNADKKGLSISLDVTVVFTITANGSDGHLEITITGSFVEEVGVDFGADVEAEWDWAAFIPYISDIRATANVDVMNYTAISFNATMITKENDDEADDDDKIGEAIDVANEIKDMLESLTKGEDGEEKEENDTQDKLVERYSDMVTQESDWIRIVEKNITEVKQSLPPSIPLINLSLAIDFVVQLDASISIGFDFEYIEGKRHVFTIKLKARDVHSDTIELVEKAYEFCFYAMGRIGLRVGVELDFSIYAISKKLGSVGFSAGAGAYTKLYGYFFYELKYTASKGKTQQYSGALLIQVGVYLELALNAQAIGGLFSATAELLDKEWLIYEAGRRDNVLDFETEQEDMPEIVLKQHVRSVILPDSVFNMHYLNLVTGEDSQAVYNDWNDPERKDDFRNGENYVITMTNKKFTYDPKTNTVAVNAEDGDIKLEGEMIITWKKQPMSFSSKPIQRTISLYWDNLRDGYMIVPYTNGGTYIPMIVKKFEATLVAPANPEKLGYKFAGWYSDAQLTSPYTFPATMPAEDINVYAKWQARDDINYTVEHYKENLRSGEYELFETESFKGTTATNVTPDVKTYTGFVSPEKAQLKVEADASATLRYYYNLERHNITFDSGKVDGVDVTEQEDITYSMKYGATITTPHMAMKGYTFVGWSTDGSTPATVETFVGTKDLTYTAMWQKNEDTDYRIEYYVQQSDGRYTLQHMIKEQTVTGKVFTEEYLRTLAIDGTKSADDKFLLADAIVFENMTVGGIVCNEATVDGSGKTVIKVNYGRIKHTLTFDPGYEGSEPIVKDVFYDAEVIAPQNITRKGYTFVGWETVPVTIMPAQSLTYRAVWTPNNYTVKFDKDSSDATGTMTNQAFTYDASQNLTTNGFIRPYYNFAGWATQRGGEAVYKNGENISNLTAVNGDEITLYAVWEPVTYTITYNANGGAHQNRTEYTTEDTFTLSDAVRTGYTFDGWYNNAECTGKAITEITLGSGGNINLYAKYIANTDTAYKVEHYQEQLDGSFVLTDTDNLKGTTDSSVTPATNNYIGFAAPNTKSVTVKADGSLVVEYRYTRNSYTITFDAAGGTVTPTTITAKYGASVTLPTPTKDGYGFDGWYNGSTIYNSATMGANNITLTAKWIAGKYSYTVNHYQQNVDGNGYTLVKTISASASMDEQITPAINTYEGFTSPAQATTINITANSAQNVVNYYYSRNKYTLVWNLGIGSAEDQDYTKGSVYYGAEVKVPVPVKTGYSFNWNETPVTTMPASDLTYTATWTPNIYKVSFDTNGGTVVSGDVTQRNVKFDSSYGALAVVEKAGYNFLGWYDGDRKITDQTILSKLSDHTLTAKFEIITYTITYNGVKADENSNPEQYTAENAVTLANPANRTGYTFQGWYEDANFSGNPITNIAKGSVGNKTFYAKWTENVYAVTFYANNGTADENTQNILYSGIVGENTFEYEGYTFVGWSDGINTYNADTALSEIVKDGMTALHLNAVWEKQKYTITYVGVDSDEHENPTEYTVDDAISLGAPNERPGYIFRGWFTNSNFEGDPVDTISVGSAEHKIFYALWEEITFTVILNANDGIGTFVKTEPLTTADAVPTNTFNRNGYTFTGWATSPDGAKVYNDNVAIADIIANANGDNEVTLYAVWSLNEYTITYSDWDIGSNSNPNASKTSYSIESASDITLSEPTAKTGYMFLGWYEGESKVTTIQKTAGKDYNLSAKWAHGGTFTISYTSTTNRISTYTVTRTLPEGTVATADPQVVYVRTVNGTAYGTTPEAATASQQDKYHFIHIDPAKEGSGKLTFNSTDLSKTITVTEKDDYNADNLISSYQIGGVARHYNVELYKVFDSTGKCDGTLGSTKSVKRNMPVSSYQVPSNLYDWYTHNIISSSNEIRITDSGYNKNDWRDIYPKNLLNKNLTDAEEKYRDLTANYYGFRATFDIKEEDKGYQWVKFTNATNRGGSTLAEYRFATAGDSKANWNYTVSLPRANSNKYSGIEFSGGDCMVENSWTVKDTSSSTPYALIDPSKDMSICFDASGNNEDNWKYRNLNVRLRVYDSTEPSAKSIAPLALTEYAQGEYVTLTVIYNEPINTISSTPTLNFQYYKILSGYVDSKLGEYFEDPTYINNGTGTNTISFRCKTKKALTASDMLTINTYLAYNESNVGGSFASNIGTLSASVGDVCSD